MCIGHKLGLRIRLPALLVGCILNHSHGFNPSSHTKASARRHDLACRLICPRTPPSSQLHRRTPMLSKPPGTPTGKGPGHRWTSATASATGGTWRHRTARAASSPLLTGATELSAAQTTRTQTVGRPPTSTTAHASTLKPILCARPGAPRGHIRPPSFRKWHSFTGRVFCRGNT